MSCRCTTQTTPCIEATPSEICLVVTDKSTSTFEFVLTDQRGEAVGLANSNVTMTIKDYVGGTTKVTKTNAPGDHTAPTDGRTTFTISSSDISESNIDDLSWVYEIRRTDLSTSAQYVHIVGGFVVQPGMG